MNEANSLRWRFDVNTFRLIGRDLITDRITAVFELVKNCYDANATRVDIIFNNVGKDRSTGQIIIKDNGVGMSFDDIKNKWMVVGTGSKRSSLYSPPPFNRRYVGEKGIGRFAVDKLGGMVQIQTKEAGSEQSLSVSINWDQYDLLSQGTQLTLFTEVDNAYEYSKADPTEHGTSLIISSINELWTDLDILRLEKELEKVVSPFHPLNPPFSIFISSNEHSAYKNKSVAADPIQYSTLHKSLGFDINKKSQESLFFNKHTGELEITQTPVRSFGLVKFNIYYFDEQGKKAFARKYKEAGRKIDGVKIYRDGVIATPFAEFESKPDKKRDILGIDKRLWSGFLDKIGTREVIALLDITKHGNPNIIDSTNRQDFVDNKEYRDLKDFVIEQLNAIGDFKKGQRKKTQRTTTISLENAGAGLKQFTKSLGELEQQKPELKSVLDPIRAKAQEIDQSITQGIIQQKKEREEYVRKENIYLSLMSLQDYAIHLSHAVRTSLGKVKRMAEFFRDRFPDARYDDRFKKFSLLIYSEMSNLNKVIDFMLSYAGSNIDFEDIEIKSLLENLLLREYEETFTRENISASVEISGSCIVHTNKKFFEDIFQNLISNSVKALRDVDHKRIKCSAFIENDRFVIYFSDNGTGIPEGDELRIFEIYYTTTADKGGAGLGLYIVKTRMESLKGSVEVAPREFEQGATFKLTFPFSKDE